MHENKRKANTLRNEASRFDDKPTILLISPKHERKHV